MRTAQQCQARILQSCTCCRYSLLVCNVCVISSNSSRNGAFTHLVSIIHPMSFQLDVGALFEHMRSVQDGVLFLTYALLVSSGPAYSKREPIAVRQVKNQASASIREGRVRQVDHPRGSPTSLASSSFWHGFATGDRKEAGSSFLTKPTKTKTWMPVPGAHHW